MQKVTESLPLNLGNGYPSCPSNQTDFLLIFKGILPHRNFLQRGVASWV